MAIIPGEAEKSVSIATPETKKTKNMLAALAVIIVVIGIILYFGMGGQPAGQPSSNSVSPAQQQAYQSAQLLESLGRVSLNSSIFNDKRFASLIFSERLPVIVGEKGRSNPFSPF